MVDTMFIEIEQQYDGVCIVRCKGPFLPGPELTYIQAKMDEVKRLACAQVLIDFQDVTWIASMGATFIVGIYTTVMKQSGGRFVLTGCNPCVRHVLDLTRLSTVIPLASDLASGLTMLRAAATMASLALSSTGSASKSQAYRDKQFETCESHTV
jgi:anti-anti-sigma factor